MEPLELLPAGGRRRWRRLASTFVFDFVVVLLGVLAAQQLQVWVQQRAAHERMVAEHARASAETARALQAARVWEVAVPCLEQRMVEIMTLATNPSPVDPTLLRRRKLWWEWVAPLSAEATLLTRTKKGEAVAATYVDLTYQSERLTNLEEILARSGRS